MFKCIDARVDNKKSNKAWVQIYRNDIPYLRRVNGEGEGLRVKGEGEGLRVKGEGVGGRGRKAGGNHKDSVVALPWPCPPSCP